MKAIRVQFKKNGKRYYFDPANHSIEKDLYVIVRTIKGLELGQVVGDIIEITEADLIGELKPIERIATKDDIETHRYLKSLEAKAIDKVKDLVRKNKLEMKVLSAEYTLDASKLNICFEADGRIDFRNLVKDLADFFKVRIELRQVGSRDGAKAFGGIGPCGLVICCNTFLNEFNNVTVKMAKNQNLSLNPLKISGTCGKLLCCISYENNLYKELRENMFDVNDIVKTKDGEAKVISIDVLNQKAKVKYLLEEKYTYINASDVIYVKYSKKNNREISESELRALEG